MTDRYHADCQECSWVRVGIVRETVIGARDYHIEEYGHEDVKLRAYLD